LRDSHMWLKRDAGCTGINSEFKYRQFHTLHLKVCILQVKHEVEFRLSLSENIIHIPFACQK